MSCCGENPVVSSVALSVAIRISVLVFEEFTVGNQLTMSEEKES